MKSNKQQRASLLQRGRSSRGPENEYNQPQFAGQQVAPSRATMEERKVEIPSRDASGHRVPSTEMFASVAGISHDDRTGVEELKMKMAQALAQKQSPQPSASSAPELLTKSPQSSGSIAQRRF